MDQAWRPSAATSLIPISSGTDALGFVLDENPA